MKVLVLAGGRGSRLWPISTKYKPKQFQKLFGSKTMLQETVGRLRPIFSIEDIYISTNEEYLKEIRKELPDLPKKNIILEPAHRERAAAILLFFAHLEKKDCQKPVLILPSDHLIKDEVGFRQAILAGERFVKKNSDYMLLLGEKPNFPDIGLGYIKKGKSLKNGNGFKIYQISFFKEKPNLQRTRAFLKTNDYFWNMAVYVFTPALVKSLIKQYIPDNYERYVKIRAAMGKKNFKEVLKTEYPKMDKVSLEYTVIENYKKNAIMPVSIGWSDIGSWAVLKKCLSSPNESFIKGNHIGIDSKNIMVYGPEDKLVATVGIKNLIVAITEDIVLVCHRDGSQRVQEVIKKLEADKNFKYI